MVVIKCPVCDENVDLGDDLFEDDLAECECCGTVLELQYNKKGSWKLVTIEEDWGEAEGTEVVVTKEEPEEIWIDEEEDENWWPQIGSTQFAEIIKTGKMLGIKSN